MEQWNSVKMIAAVVAGALLIVATQAQAIIAYTFPAGLTGNGAYNPPYILGSEFVVGSSDISVTRVGAFSSQGQAFTVDVPVAIYQQTGSTWTEIAATAFTFSSANQGILEGTARFQTLGTPVTLFANATYAIVGANYGGTANPAWDATTSPPPSEPPAASFTGSPSITMATPKNTFYVQGATLPGTLSGVAGGNWPAPLAGATFDFTPVPEAATFGAAAIGLLGLVYIGRYAGLRRKMRLG